MQMRTDASELVAFLECLEALSEALVQYVGSTVQARALDGLQAACWDLEEVGARGSVACAACGASAAEEWLVAFQAYSAAGARASAAVKASAWSWARGLAGDHGVGPTQALAHLELAGTCLLDATVRLARVGARLADEGAAAAQRAGLDIPHRFAAVRSIANGAADLTSAGRVRRGPAGASSTGVTEGGEGHGEA